MKRVFTSFIITIALAACEKIDISTPPANDSPGNNIEMLQLVNDARKKGCNCGNEWMPPVPPLTWNNKLETAAKQHSDYMLATGDLTTQKVTGAPPAAGPPTPGIDGVISAKTSHQARQRQLR